MTSGLSFKALICRCILALPRIVRTSSSLARPQSSATSPICLTNSCDGAKTINCKVLFFSTCANNGNR